MKKIFSVLLVIAIVISVFAGCGSGDSYLGSKDNGEETSYYNWVGRFELQKMELNGSTFVKADIAKMGWHADQYVVLNENGTGRVGLSASSSDTPLFVYDVTYTYDITCQNGDINVVDNGERYKFEFEISGNLLTLDLNGVKMTFKKV